ncbi:hypothetical protein H0H87_011305 [Tephrocybe sp. NHM501043]|nr:hypothetical protein H0H87_011305 [Tephrocybe sp. NHM501043]
MTADEEILLRDIGVLLLGNLAGFTAMTLVYGLNRGFKNRATAIVFTTAVITFLIATVYWCAYLASFATLVRGILVDTDIGPLDTGGSYDGINQKNLRFVRMQSWTAQLLVSLILMTPCILLTSFHRKQPMISDAVLVWRVHVMYPANSFILIVPIVLLAGTIGESKRYWESDGDNFKVLVGSGFGLLGVISSQDFNVTGVLGATKLWKDIFLSYLSLSLATNVVCSLFITKHMIHLQREKGNIGKKLNMSQLRVLSIVFIETGLMYASSQAINLALELVKPKQDSSLYFAAVVITSIYAVCAAMYPTVVILLQVIQRSTLHLFEEIPIIAKPANVAVKSARARTATRGHLSFAAPVTHHTNGSDTSTETPQIVSFAVNGQPEKAQTVIDSSERLDQHFDEKQTKTI